MLVSRLADGCVRHTVRLLHAIYQSADIGPHLVGRSAADGYLGWPRDAAWADRRGHACCRGQNSRERLYRALEFSARRHLRRYCYSNARRPGAWNRSAVAAGMAQTPTWHDPGSWRGGGKAMNALTVTGLCKSFGGLHVTTDVNLNVEPGERRLIIGPNGAGKTTLFNLITGELTPDSGSIQLFGRDITRVASRRRAHLGMARTYQIITLFARDTILHNVTLALLGLSPARWNPLIDLRRQGHFVEHAQAALERVGLGHIANRPLAQTAYGERRRVEIAMALTQNPKVLLLDEPFAGLSIDERRDVQQLLLEIPRDVTIVMIEHNMDVALKFAERITLLHFGEVIVEGNRAEVVADSRTREVYLGH